MTTIHAPNELGLSAFAAWLDRTDELLGLDVETTMIDKKSPMQWAEDFRLRTVQLADTETAWVLDTDTPLGRQCLDLATGHKTFVSHTDYDLRSSYCGLGLDLTETTVDCHVLACLARPGGVNDLKTLSSVYLDDALIEAEKALYARGKELAPVGERVGDKLKHHIYDEIDVNDEAFVRYAGLDAIYVRRVHDALTTELTRKNMAHLIDREQRLWRLFVRKALHPGTRLDLKTAEAIYREVDATHEDARRRFTGYTGGLAPLSPYRDAWLVEHGADLAKAPATKGTKDLPKAQQKPQLTKDTLPMLAAENDTPELRLVWQAMLTISATKNLRDNLRNMITGADSTSHGHPVTKTMGAKTARFSVTGVPLQTFNKKDKRLRSIILAEPGWVFVGADYDAVEWRMAAGLSQDPVLIRVLKAGEDLHDNTARALFGEGFTDEQRGIGKGMGFGCLYGGGAQTLAGQVGTTVARAAEHIKRLKATYPTCFQYLRKLADYPGITTPWGRKIPADWDRGYANGNYMIQSSARDLMVDALFRLIDDCGVPASWIEMCVHDEIILQVPEWAVEFAIAALNAAMNTTFRGVPITAKAKLIGPTWGSKGAPRPEAVAA